MAGNKGKKRSMEDQLEAIIKNLDEMKDQMKDLKTDNQTMSEQLGAIQEDNKRLEQKMNNMIKDNKALLTRVRTVEQNLAQKDKEIDKLNSKVLNLEEKLAEQEQYSKRDNIIIQGLKVAKPYSRAADANEGPTMHDEDKWSKSDKMIMRANIINFAKEKLKVTLVNADIQDVHVLHNQERSEKGSVIVRFTNRLARDSFYQARIQQKRVLYDEKIYLNEHLTPKTAGLFKKARELRKEQKITHVWTKNCRLLVRLLNNDVKQVTGDEFFNDFH